MSCTTHCRLTRKRFASSPPRIDPACACIQEYIFLRRRPAESERAGITAESFAADRGDVTGRMVSCQVLCQVTRDLTSLLQTLISWVSRVLSAKASQSNY